MNIAYCGECKPPTVIGAPVGLGPCSHKLANGTVHRGKTLRVADAVEDRRGKGEAPQAYLDRLATKYAAKLT
jgi:hypothetical protein